MSRERAAHKQECGKIDQQEAHKEGIPREEVPREEVPPKAGSGRGDGKPGEFMGEPTSCIVPPRAEPAIRRADLADERGPIPTFPPRRVDAAGRLVPIPDDERRARVEALARALAALDRLPDTDPPGVDAEVMRSIDEGRPHRPLFEGMY